MLGDPMDYTVHGIPQARILEWVAIPSSRGSSQLRDWTQVSHIAGRFFTSWDTRETHIGLNILLKLVLPLCARAMSVLFLSIERTAAAAAAAKSLQLCLTLCDPIDGSPPGSPIPRILQAKIAEWVAISFSSAWKWKVKVKSLSRVQLLAIPWTAAYQAPLSCQIRAPSLWPYLTLVISLKFLSPNTDTLRVWLQHMNFSRTQFSP